MKIHQEVHDDNLDTLSKNSLTYLKIIGDKWTQRFHIVSFIDISQAHKQKYYYHISNDLRVNLLFYALLFYGRF